MTGADTNGAPARASTAPRSTVAVKLALLSRFAASTGARYRIPVTSGSTSRMKALAGWLRGSMGTWPGHVRAFWETTIPA